MQTNALLSDSPPVIDFRAMVAAQESDPDVLQIHSSSSLTLKATLLAMSDSTILTLKATLLAMSDSTILCDYQLVLLVLLYLWHFDVLC